jgi:succinoglycan biosynthesis transport protein ExoP
LFVEDVMTDSPDSLNRSGLEFFSLRDYAKIFFRRRWFISIATLAVAALVAIVVYFLPNSYRATTVILVSRQKVPEYYVNSTMIANASERLDTLRQQILSSARLAQIIDEMGLYKELKKRHTQDEIVEQMRKETAVAVAPTTHNEKNLEAFTVSYSNSNPTVAARVTNRLASLVIEDNIKNREQSVMGTADFLEKELEDARQDLKVKEDKITELKTKNVNVIPESATSHVQALNSLQLELQNNRDTVTQEEQQKIYLQSILGGSPLVVNLDSQESPEVSGMEAEKAQLEGEMDELRRRYGPSYPEIVKKTTQIRDLESRIAEAKHQQGSQPKARQTPTKERNPVVQSQIAKLDDDIRQRKERETKLEEQILHHQSELARIPVFQQQISSVMREYDAAQDHYKHLADRNFSASMAADLEIRQKGERFEVVEPAQVPYKPTSPDRPMLNLMGLAAGLAFGFVSALFLEIIDLSLKTEQQVVSQVGAPVFCEIPWLPTPVETRRRRLRTNYARAGCAALAVVYSVFLFVTWP